MNVNDRPSQECYRACVRLSVCLPPPHRARTRGGSEDEDQIFWMSGAGARGRWQVIFSIAQRERTRYRSTATHKVPGNGINLSTATPKARSTGLLQASPQRQRRLPINGTRPQNRKPANPQFRKAAKRKNNGPTNTLIKHNFLLDVKGQDRQSIANTQCPAYAPSGFEAKAATTAAAATRAEGRRACSSGRNWSVNIDVDVIYRCKPLYLLNPTKTDVQTSPGIATDGQLAAGGQCGCPACAVYSVGCSEASRCQGVREGCRDERGAAAGRRQGGGRCW